MSRVYKFYVNGKFRLSCAGYNFYKNLFKLEKEFGKENVTYEEIKTANVNNDAIKKLIDKLRD